MSISPWVCDCSGERFSVQLMKTARRSLKSQVLWRHSSSCLALSANSFPFRTSCRRGRTLRRPRWRPRGSRRHGTRRTLRVHGRERRLQPRTQRGDDRRGPRCFNSVSEVRYRRVLHDPRCCRGGTPWQRDKCSRSGSRIPTNPPSLVSQQRPRRPPRGDHLWSQLHCAIEPAIRAHD